MATKRARDVMTTDIITVTQDVKLTKAMKLLIDNRISGLPVLAEDGKLIGIITEHDIVNFAFSGEADNTTVKQAMTREVFTFAPDVNLYNIINCFASNRVRRVPIVYDGKVVGIVSRRDILKEMLAMYGES